MRAAIHTTRFEDRALLSGDRNRLTADDHPRVDQQDGSRTKANNQAN